MADININVRKVGSGPPTGLLSVTRFTVGE